MEEQLRQMRQRNERGSSNPKYQASERRRRLADEVPNEFKCSITMEIMQDPVIAADGHTYERAAITQWFAHHNTSPKTNALLPNRTLIPNHSSRTRIRDWLVGYQGEMDGGAFFDF